MQNSPPQVAKGAMWMTGAILSFSAMAVAGREVSLSLDTFEIMTYRSAVGLLIVSAVLLWSGQTTQVQTNRLPLHVLRNLFHFTGQNLWFYAVTVIPLAQLFALEFTSPIWLILLAPFFLGEKMTRARLITVALGFVGVLLIARPEPGSFSLGVACAAASALFFACTNIATKRLTQNEPVGSILFWLTAMQLAFGIVCAGWDGDVALPTATNLPFILIIGCAGLMAHLSITKALSLAPAATVIPIDFARLPFIAVLGWLLYGESLDLWLALGAALIIGGNLLNLFAARPR